MLITSRHRKWGKIYYSSMGKDLLYSNHSSSLLHSFTYVAMLGERYAALK